MSKLYVDEIHPKTTGSAVLMPNKPLASVSRSSDMAANVTTYPTIIFNQIDLDVGGNYDSSNGVFTCPISGIYQVTCFGMDSTSGAAGALYLRLEKNGVNYGSDCGSYSSANSHAGASGTWMIQCSVNDTLEISYYATSGVTGTYSGATFMLIG
jgi:hypothetical protein